LEQLTLLDRDGVARVRRSGVSSAENLIIDYLRIIDCEEIVCGTGATRVLGERAYQQLLEEILGGDHPPGAPCAPRASRIASG